MESVGTIFSFSTRSMRAVVLLLFGAILLTTAPGCGMFQQGQQRPHKDGLTLEEWMKQPRVQPQ